MLLYSKFLYFIYQQTANVTVGMLIVLSIFGLYNAKKLMGEYKILLYLWIGYSIFELISINLHHFGILHNQFIGHPYSIFAILISSWFYSKVISSPKAHLLIIFVCTIYIAGCIIQIFFSEKEIKSPILFPLKNILTLTLSIWVQQKIMKSNKIKSIKNEPLYWFNIGFMIINFSNLIITPIFNQVTYISDNIAFITGIIMSIPDPITYTLWAIGIYKLRTLTFRPIASLWP